MSSCCKNCFFFVKTGNGIGECHVFPPEVVYVKTLFGKHKYASALPVVPEDSFCSQFEGQVSDGAGRE